MKEQVYCTELHYFFDQPDFPLAYALEVTAGAVARWCTHYYAETPVGELPGWPWQMRRGELPKYEPLPWTGPDETPVSSEEHRSSFGTELARWCVENCGMAGELDFVMHLDDEPIDRETHRRCKFDHHDDTCCWWLRLTDTEFGQLQRIWVEEGLPEDLFYASGTGCGAGDRPDTPLRLRYGTARWWPGEPPR